MELQDTLLLVHPKFCVHPNVQLGKGMLLTAPNEGVPTIVLSLPSSHLLSSTLDMLNTLTSKMGNSSGVE